MRLNESTLSELRGLYAIIYHWHREYGVRKLKLRLEAEGNIQHSDWYQKYFDFLEQLPPPQSAELISCLELARAVLSGCMEWSYGEIALDGVRLSEVARQIQGIIKIAKSDQSDEEKIRILKTLRNTAGKQDAQPNAVEISVSQNEENHEVYLKYARVAYSDVIQNPNENLGGQVALADTNLENEERDGFGHEKRSKVKFRNAKAMHFEVENQQNSLVTMAKTGVVSILSVKIGI